MEIDDKSKDFMISKIKSIHYRGDDCDDNTGSHGRISIDSDLVPNAFYKPETNDFYVCNGLLLAGQSDFHLIFVMVHELSHSIDPCGLQFATSGENINYDKKSIDRAESQYPIRNLIKCLRTSDSVEAKRDEGKFAAMYRRVFGQDRKTFCNGDQIGESIADWFGASAVGSYMQKISPQISPDEALKGISNVWKP